jgi:hypothetical protein
MSLGTSSQTVSNVTGALKEKGRCGNPQRPFDDRIGRLYQKKPGITSRMVPL